MSVYEGVVSSLKAEVHTVHHLADSSSRPLSVSVRLLFVFLLRNMMPSGQSKRASEKCSRKFKKKASRQTDGETEGQKKKLLKERQSSTPRGTFSLLAVTATNESAGEESFL